MMDEIIHFLYETEKLKGIERETSPIGFSRRENSAEHSWSIALMAVVLIDQIDPSLDKVRVLEMILIHDIVEIDAGDHFCYGSHDAENLQKREKAAADRIFGLLPEETSRRLRALWDEFEAKETKESLFANALDRFGPTLQNYQNGGGTWVKHQITQAQFMKRNQLVKDHFPAFWQYDEQILEQAIENGWISAEPDRPVE